VENDASDKIEESDALEQVVPKKKKSRRIKKSLRVQPVQQKATTKATQNISEKQEQQSSTQVPQSEGKKKGIVIQNSSNSNNKKGAKKANFKEDLSYLDRLNQFQMMTLCQETENKCKDFWGPLEALNPLRNKIEKMMTILDTKFSDQEITHGPRRRLQESLNLLDNRAPMIESAANEDQDSEDETNAFVSKTYQYVAQIGMKALRLNKQIRCDTPKKRGHINILMKQFIKCQTDLDALNLDHADDIQALEASRDIQIFCNDALKDLNKLLDGCI
jgi:hypothetical protein